MVAIGGKADKAGFSPAIVCPLLTQSRHERRGKSVQTTETTLMARQAIRDIAFLSGVFRLLSRPASALRLLRGGP
jgi:hypothetical protein